MATFSNVSKNIVSVSNTTKNVVSIDNFEKAGGAWIYNEPNLLYNSPLDPDTGDPVYYNGIGTVTTFTNLAKS